MDSEDFDYIFDELMDEGLTADEASNFISCMISDEYENR